MISGSIDSSVEVDTYTFEALAGDKISLNVSSPDSFNLFPQVMVYDSDGNLLESSSEPTEVDIQLSIETRTTNSYTTTRRNPQW
ncbi:hypothetical protein ACP6PL_28340 [Dapis sp. BLCC M126]|uniref:hypothetical protein n=1 Tax=Dapis sp. BLCC M126 TaxID=3400189 RepID=UPI003CF3A729